MTTKTPETTKADAVTLLKKDHREAESLFKEFEKAKDADDQERKFEIATKVAAALLIHMQIEEEIFYPAALQATGDEDLLTEARVEHDSAKELIAHLGKLDPTDAEFDANVKVLSEQIEHHVDEEENSLFPELRKTSLDLDALGKTMAEAKLKLHKKHGLAAE
jgi:iron-sulfur cluster repair protein YtfE (RIC family)